MDPLLPGYRTLDVEVVPHEGEIGPDTEVRLELLMPEHDHGKSFYEDSEALGEGRYRFENVLLGMHGKWEFHLIIGRSGYGEELARFSVEVPAP